MVSFSFDGLALTFVYFDWLEFIAHRVQRDEDQDYPNILDDGQQLKWK